jgi:nicotinamide-nucleotide amidase
MNNHGLISPETAEALASAARHELASDVGIGVTGIAGTEPVEGKPPGTCFIAVELDSTREVREIRRPGSREMVKRYVSQCALDLLRRQLLRIERS